MASLPFPMRSTLLLAWLIQFAALSNSAANDLVPYVSPGLKIGWDSNRGFTMGPKLGIGLAGVDEDKFLNLTIGIKSFQIAGSDNSKFVFLDLQIGTTFKDESWLAVEQDC